jgi:hypothetical protein
MGFFRNKDEQAVLIHLDGVGLPEEIYEEYDLLGLEDALTEDLERTGAGEFDGDEMGDAVTTVYLYGKDADDIFRAVEKTLRQYPLCKGARVVLREGPPGAREKEIRL